MTEPHARIIEGFRHSVAWTPGSPTGRVRSGRTPARPETSDLFIWPKPTTYPLTVKNIEAATAESVGTQFLTRSEVSRMLGVSPNTVTRWAREGRLPCQVTLGGHHRFDRELVDQLRRSLYRAGGRAD